MTTLLELAKKLHNTLALYKGAGHAIGWNTEKVDKLLDESKQVIKLAEQQAQPARKPLTDEQQIAKALRRHGLTLVKTAKGYDVMSLWHITAHGIKENT